MMSMNSELVSAAGSMRDVDLFVAFKSWNSAKYNYKFAFGSNFNYILVT